MEFFEDLEVLNAQQKIKELVRVSSIKESVRTILKASPKKFFLVFFTLILPLSFLQFMLEINNLNVAFIVFVYQVYHLSSPEHQSTNPLVMYKEIVGAYPTDHFFLKLNSIRYYCISLVLFFAFYLLSVSATTFTVASLYVSKPLSYSSILSAIPRIIKRLAITFLHALPLIFLHYTAYLAVLALVCTIVTLIGTVLKINYVLVFVIGTILVIFYVCFVFVVHGNFVAWWNFANMVSVLEPNIYGSAAIKKSKQLLQKKKFITGFLVFFYLGTVYEIACIAEVVLTLMGNDANIIVRLLVSSLFVMALAVVNFLGLTAQNLKYYQNQVVGQGVLNESVIEMQGLVGNDNGIEDNLLEV
ncbi:uncharacterized protein LOC113351810 [Papaver somniferum]|uniref:uncharacterized protein LOC113351810 n=1 Tax=Papaver somniferum TaxID=3469 RepID=UPI000E700363|nr:uncharacterized protein LOC113351810 [Papaver somniferum]